MDESVEHFMSMTMQLYWAMVPKMRWPLHSFQLTVLRVVGIAEHAVRAHATYNAPSLGFAARPSFSIPFRSLDAILALAEPNHSAKWRACKRNSYKKIALYFSLSQEKSHAYCVNVIALTGIHSDRRSIFRNTVFDRLTFYPPKWSSTIFTNWFSLFNEISRYLIHQNNSHNRDPIHEFPCKQCFPFLNQLTIYRQMSETHQHQQNVTIKVCVCVACHLKCQNKSTILVLKLKIPPNSSGNERFRWNLSFESFFFSHFFFSRWKIQKTNLLKKAFLMPHRLSNR